jgi:hypothetical protein
LVNQGIEDTRKRGISTMTNRQDEPATSRSVSPDASPGDASRVGPDGGRDGFLRRLLRRTNPPAMDMTMELLAKLDSVKPQDLDKRTADLASESLQWVNRLTDYEDQKASRVLSAIAFISALVAGMYGVLTPRQPDGSIQVLSGAAHISPCATLYHGLFFLYCFLIVCGAMLVVWSIRPRFDISRSHKAQLAKGASARKARPRSFLFAPVILQCRPAEWVDSFLNRSSEELTGEYAKDFIHETYLIAEKTRAKLRVMQPGMFMLALACLVLAIWVPLAGYLVATRGWT